MSIDSQKCKYSLPPNVHGKYRGKLELEIVDILWSSDSITSVKRASLQTKTKQSIGSGGILLKFTWWGQSHKEASVLKLRSITENRKNKFKVGKIIYYIQTRSDLFQNYLDNCEPIVINLSSITSNLQIGTVFIRIPIELLHDYVKPVEVVKNFPIFNTRSINIGNIKIKFTMIFHAALPYNVKTPADLQEPDFHLNLDTYAIEDKCIEKPLESGTNRDNEKYDDNFGNISCIDMPLDSARFTNHSIISSSVIDYLSGRKMTQKDELALEKIRITSPITNILNAVLNERISKFNNIIMLIDSIRLHIGNLHISSAGMREISLISLRNVTFTIECRLPPNLVQYTDEKFSYDVMRFYSESFDDENRKIGFNKELVRIINIPHFNIESPQFDNACLIFNVWWRQFGTKYSKCLGTANFQLNEMFEKCLLEQKFKLNVKSCTGDMSMGYIILKIKLGHKGVHIEEDCLEILSERSSKPQPYLIASSRPNSSREENKNSKSTVDTEYNSSSTRRGNDQRTDAQRDHRASKSNENKLESGGKGHCILDSRPKDESNLCLLHGLLYVSSMRNVKALQNGAYFLVCRAFWKEDVSSTEFCVDNHFNFLETFPVLKDEKFLERSKSNHLILELWQKFTDTAEQMVGIIKLPLHQFYIAFRDAAITEHLRQIKLPVISIDGWVPIMSPLSGDSCGQLQVLLAIGTEEQLEYLKTSRGLTINRIYEINTNKNDIQIPVPELPQRLRNSSDQEVIVSCDAESQTSFESKNPKKEKLSDLLGSFLENLTQNIPTDRISKSIPATVTQTTGSYLTQSAINMEKTMTSGELKKTSDLLESLEKALTSLPNTNNTPKPPTQIVAETQKNNFQILLIIENALHLPRNPLKIMSKKSGKRNSGNTKYKQTKFPPGEEPSAYVTFQAEEGQDSMIKSHEGLVYSTNVIEKCCNPVWNKRFEISVPADLFTNNEKRFILKIWRKAASNSSQCRLIPNPIEDSVIGFAAIDLNVLLVGMPCISGWFNVVDFNGRINGQIKVTAEPLEDIMRFRQESHHNPLQTNNSQYNNLISTNIPTTGTTSVDLHNTTLSRAIKRKFTELEEITQRLRARLLDVTGDMEVNEEVSNENVNDDQLDEFEHDLNTECTEEENENDGKDFAWLGTSLATVAPNICNSIASDSSSTDNSHERIAIIADCLRKTDISDSPTSKNSPDGEVGQFFSSDRRVEKSCTKYTSDTEENCYNTSDIEKNSPDEEVGHLFSSKGRMENRCTK